MRQQARAASIVCASPCIWCSAALPGRLPIPSHAICCRDQDLLQKLTATALSAVLVAGSAAPALAAAAPAAQQGALLDELLASKPSKVRKPLAAEGGPIVCCCCADHATLPSAQLA